VWLNHATDQTDHEVKFIVVSDRPTPEDNLCRWIERHPGELYSRVILILAALARPAEHVIAL
jgi:hypothetical protein